MTAHDGDWRFLTVCVRTQSTSNWTTNDLEHPANNIITLWTDSNAHIQDSVLEDTARRLDETKRWLKDVSFGPTKLCSIFSRADTSIG